MKKYIYLAASFISVMVLVGSPVLVKAATLPDTAAQPGASPLLAPLLITEVQAGSVDSASQEFVELLNTTDAPIDFSMHSWQLQFASGAATDWSAPLRTIQLTGTVQPHAYYVAASQYTSDGQTVQYLPDTASVWFSAGLSAAGGHVRLAYGALQQQDGACILQTTVVDELEWSVYKNSAPATPSLDGRTLFAEEKTAGLPPGNSLQRHVVTNSNAYMDTNNDAVDFGLAVPSPGAQNTLPADASGTAQVLARLPADACSLAPPDTGSGDSDSSGGTGVDDGDTGESDGDSAADPNTGLLPPQITELLPNPAAPQTDEADEFIELYNPNAAAFDASGYVLTVGTSTTHSYTFPTGTKLAPDAFTAFSSADTGLSLSNSGGQVQLSTADGVLLSQSDGYGTAKDGQAWALINGTWQWTDTPTPNAANSAAVVLAPAVKAAATAKAAAPKKTTAAAKTSTAKAKTTTAKAKKKTAKTTKASTFVANTADAKSPLHPAILATVVLLAVLYGAYEYRHDMANHIRRLRDNRAHRRKNRPGLARRRDD